MSNKIQARTLIRNLVASGQIRRYRRSEYQRNRTSKLNRLSRSAWRALASIWAATPYIIAGGLAFVCGALWWL